MSEYTGGVTEAAPATQGLRVGWWRRWIYGKVDAVAGEGLGERGLGRAPSFSKLCPSKPLFKQTRDC